MDMSVEVMLKYPSAYLAVACVALAQLLYLLWWGQAFDLALRSTQSTQTGTGAVLLMLLNFYWTTQVFRLVVVMVTVGVISHWFANAYPPASLESPPPIR